MLQARLLGKELYVGVHSDEEILHNKGPVVMNLDERMTAVNGCKWTTKAVADAPYVTSPAFMQKHGCKYVVHGDDITTDANGEDTYQEVKDLGIFVVVKRTPNISTTDLVGRMLLMGKTHHFKPLKAPVLEQPLFQNEGALERFRKYASDETGLKDGSAVHTYLEPSNHFDTIVQPSPQIKEKMKAGVVYIDGGFDLFHPGHIEALRLAKEHAGNKAVVVGLHDDAVINRHKGLNYPIMNLFERSLCVLQCRYVDAVVIGAPYSPTPQFLRLILPNVKSVLHGPTHIEESVYNDVKDILVQIGPHKFDDINTELIVKRVLDNKVAYEERQRRKGWKAEVEKRLREEEKVRQGYN